MDVHDATSAGSRRAKPASRRREKTAETSVVRRRVRGRYLLRLRDDGEKAAQDDDSDDEAVTKAKPTKAQNNAAVVKVEEDDDKTQGKTTNVQSNPAVVKEEDEDSEDEDDKKTKSSSTSTTTTSSPAVTSSPPTLTTPPPTSTPPPSSTAPSQLPPPPPPPPPPQVLTTLPQPVATTAPTTTRTPEAVTQAPTTIESLTLVPTSIPDVPAAAATPDQVQTQTQTDNGGNNRNQNQQHHKPPYNSAAIALAVIVSLAIVSLIGFFLWRCYRRRRAREAEEFEKANEPPENNPYYSAAKSDIRIMDEAMAAAYAAEGGGIDSSTQYDQESRASDSTPGWFKRQVNKVTQGGSDQAAAEPERPKQASVNKWMDRHTSRMLDPMAARASMVSSVPSDLGPPPSVSPASVVGGNRESVLSEMGQIRRAAVPPPLDLAMVEKARKLHDEQQEKERQKEIARTQALLDPPPPIGGPQGVVHSPSVYSPGRTEASWNTWGLEQHLAPSRA